MIKTDMRIVLFFEDVGEREIYDRLDTVIQFLVKNKLSCNIQLDRHESNPDEYKFDDGD